MSILTKTGAEVFAGVDGGGAPRQIIPAEVVTWATEIENIYVPPGTTDGVGFNGGASGDVWYRQRFMVGTKAVGADATRQIYSPSGTMDDYWDTSKPSNEAEFVCGHRIRQLVTDSIASGGRETLSISLEMRKATASTNLNRHYAAIQSKAFSFEGDGGTGLTLATAKGALFGGGWAAYAGNPYGAGDAVNLFDFVGGEVNTFGKPGSSSRYVSGVSVVLNNAFRGSAIDAMVRMSGQSAVGVYTGHIGTEFGVLFTNANGADPTYSGSTLFGSKWFNLATGNVDTTARAITNGIDLSGFAVSGDLLKGQRARIRDDGTTVTYGATANVVFAPADVPLLALSGAAGGNQQIAIVGGGAGVTPYFLMTGAASDINMVFRPKGNGTLDIKAPVQTTIGGAGGAAPQPATPLGYARLRIDGVGDVCVAYHNP